MARDGQDVAEFLRSADAGRAPRAIGQAALARVLGDHTYVHRAARPMRCSAAHVAAARGRRMSGPLDIVFIGLTLSSSWGNGHATTYRALLRGLAQEGHRVLFLERDVPWYASNRDLPDPDFCELALYRDLEANCSTGMAPGFAAPTP